MLENRMFAMHFPLMMRSSAINADKIKYCLLASENGCKKMKSGNQTEIPKWIQLRRLSKARCCFHLGTQWFWITNLVRYYKNYFKKHRSSVQLMNSTKPRVNIFPRSHGFWRRRLIEIEWNENIFFVQQKLSALLDFLMAIARRQLLIYQIHNFMLACFLFSHFVDFHDYIRHT